jgi:DNA replication and repair protein RecF
MAESDLHLLYGPNGSGKTNVIEALSVLALTKSALGHEEPEVVMWGANFYRVRATVRTDDGEERTLEVVSQLSPRKQKACFRNDVRLQLTEMVGQLPTVLFLPQDLQLFSGPPAERRRFIDQLLCQVLPEYFEALVTYQKVLKQRNSLLKAIRDGIAGEDTLEPWDAQAAAAGSILRETRLELIETFGLMLADEIRSLGELWSDIQILYERDGSARSRAELQTEILESFRRTRQRDVLLQSTCTGPHRDDWTLIIDGRELSTFGSRGQQRVCALALTALEASYLELRRNEKPIVLLDDVFSELDDAHQRAVLTAFTGHQLFLTSTHLPPLPEDREASAWRVTKGQVEAESAVESQVS